MFAASVLVPSSALRKTQGYQALTFRLLPAGVIFALNRQDEVHKSHPCLQQPHWLEVFSRFCGEQLIKIFSEKDRFLRSALSKLCILA